MRSAVATEEPPYFWTTRLTVLHYPFLGHPNTPRPARSDATIFGFRLPAQANRFGRPRVGRQAVRTGAKVVRTDPEAGGGSPAPLHREHRKDAPEGTSRSATQ